MRPISTELSSSNPFNDRPTTPLLLRDSKPNNNLNYTITLSPDTILPLTQTINFTLPASVQQQNDFFKKAVSFISEINAAPPYGYRDNFATGLGQYMMQPAAIAIARLFNDPSPFQKIIGLVIAAVSLPLTILGAALKSIAMQFPEYVGELTSDTVPRTAAKKVDQIYDLMKTFDELCRKHGINYFVQGGTCLGAIRHKEMIPWDDDADVGVMEEDEQKILGLATELKQRGIIFVSNRDGGIDHFHQLRFDPQVVRDKYQATEAEAGNLDIFLYRKMGDGKVHFSSAVFRSTFPKDYFLESEMEQIIDYPFGPGAKAFPIRAIRNATDYLTRFFGPDCLEYGVQTHEHLNIFNHFIPIPVFRKTRYKIVPGGAIGNEWK